MSETGNGEGTAVATTNERQKVIQELRNASEAVLRQRFGNLAGLSHGRDRDIWKVAGYPETYTFSEGWSRYKRQDIARRVIDLPVQKTWRHAPEILDGEEPETEFTEAWYDLWTRLKLTAQFEKADRMASIGEYSIIFLGLAGAATDAALKEPVEEGSLSGPDDVLFARPYKQSDVTVQKWVTDANDERFGKPLTYRIDLGGGDSKFQAASVEAHWTRVLHIVEDPLDSDVYGMPRLEPILNRLIDLEKIAAATGEAYWQLAAKILKATIDPKAAIDDPALEDLDEALEEIVHDLRRHFMGQGVDLDFLGGDTPDPTGPFELCVMLIAASRGIPKRILLGSERGELASSQDERAFLGLVAERIEQYAEPTVVRQFTDRMISFGALPEPRAGAEDYTLIWPALYEESPSEMAEADKNTAETARALTPVGGSPLDIAEIDEEGRVRLRPTAIQEAMEPVDPVEPDIPDEGIEDDEGPEDEMLDNAA